MLSGKRSITIQGCGRASQIRYTQAGPLFTVEGSTDILFRDFAVDSPNADIFHLAESQRVRISDCILQSNPGKKAVVVQGPRNEALTIEGCHIGALGTAAVPPALGPEVGLALEDGYELTGLFVRHNHLRATRQAVQAAAGKHLANAHFESNTIEDSHIGIDFALLPVGADVVMQHNLITVSQTAISVAELNNSAVLRLAENRIGQQDNLPNRGVEVEQMWGSARLILDGNQITTETGGALRVGRIDQLGEVHVNANVFSSSGNLPVIAIGMPFPDDELRDVNHILFNNNQVYADQVSEIRGTVVLNASRLVVMGNYVADQAEFRGPSIWLPFEPDGATAIGNLTRHGISPVAGNANVAIINNIQF
jgi:hypothetical protein